MASEGMQELHSDPENCSEPEEALLGGEQKMRRWNRLAVLGAGSLGLFAAALALWSGSKHTHTAASLSSLQEKVEEGPAVCWMDSPSGMIEMDMAEIPNGVCAKYTYSGSTVHVPSDKDTCAAMKSMPATYMDVVCCTKDKCNGDDEKKKGPAVCWTDSPYGLIEMDMASIPNGICAMYTFGGDTVHVPVDAATCDTMKSSPETYKDVLCCTEDKCNGEDSKKVKAPSMCWADTETPGLPMKKALTPSPDNRCIKITTTAGEVLLQAGIQSTCDVLKSTATTSGYSKVECCATDLCNLAE